MVSTRLGTREVSRSFGSVRALVDVTFAVVPGTIHALLGENGAGKTTLIRSLSGLDHPDTGTIVSSDRPVRFAKPTDAFAAGVAVVQQELALSPGLTLLENLVLGIEPTRYGRVQWNAARRRAEDLADSIGARIPWTTPASDTDVGTRQQVEIVRCLFRGADTLIFDEPSAVLAPSQIDALLGQLTRLRDSGNTIVLITHKLDEALAVADDITVLRAGRVVDSKPVGSVDRDGLSRMIVGESLPPDRHPRSSRPGAPVVILRDVELQGRRQPVGPVDLEVRSGEILGVAGVAGNGQDELAEALIGLRPVRRGQITLDDSDITASSVAVRRGRGMSFISADRRHEGLTVTEPLVDNVIIGCHRRAPLARHGWLSHRRARRYAAEVLARFNVRFGSIGDPALSLSGGNQQKLVFGREMTLQPRVLIAAQPTRGVDVRGIQELHRVLADARDDGVAIVLVSQELDELIALCDRILVMYRGSPNGQFDPADPKVRTQVGAAMLSELSQSEPVA